jgi:hypothetical protein
MSSEAMDAPTRTLGPPRRGALRLGAALALAVAWAASPSAGREPADEAPPTLHVRTAPGGALAEDADATPEERLCDAHERVEDARRTLAEAKIAYRRMRRDDYPRGDARELIEVWRTGSREELAEAELRLAVAREEVERTGDADDVLAACRARVPAAPAPTD